MRTRSRGRFIGLVRASVAAAVLSSAAFAGTASAAPATHLQEHFVDLHCVPLSAPGASAYLQASHSSLLGSEARFSLWIEPDYPWSSDPNVVSGAADFTVAADDSRLGGTFELLDRDGATVGSGTLDASLTPVGDPQHVRWPKSNSNFKHRESQVIQDMQASGTLRLALNGQELVMPLEDCQIVFAADFTAFENAPSALVAWQSSTVLSCQFLVNDLFVQLGMQKEAGLVASEVVVITPDGSFVTLDDGSGTRLSGTRYSTSLDLVPSDGGHGIAATGGTISADATLRPQQRSSWSEDFGDVRLRVSIQPYSVSGSATLALDDGTTLTFQMDSSSCWAEELGYRVFVRDAGSGH
jgi:hypothetical protein